MRVAEVGHIVYSPALQRTPLATEAQYLLARYVFETLGYRRYEWKCNALNAPSHRAALRYGFVLEGILRQHMIAKGRNRDTTYFSMLDSEWPARKPRSNAGSRRRISIGMGGRRRSSAINRKRHSGARAKLASPESRNLLGACVWIPGSGLRPAPE